MQSCKSGIIERLDILQDVEKDSEDDSKDVEAKSSKDAEDIEAEINKFHESCVNILSRIDICSKNLQHLDVSINLHLLQLQLWKYFEKL